MRVGRLPERTGDLRADAIGELRWAMAGAGLTVDKIVVMVAVSELPVVVAATNGVPVAARPSAAYEAIAVAARDLGDGLQARLLRASLGIDYTGGGNNLTARRLEFVGAHNARVRAAAGNNFLGDTTRAAYAVEQEMLGALVTRLGAPPGIRAHTTSATRAFAENVWETVDYDVTYRLRGRVAREAEVVHVIRALVEGLDRLHVAYFCENDAGAPTGLHLLEGGTVLEDRAIGRPTFRTAVIRYPAPLRAGQTHRVRYDMTYAESPAQEPWFTLGIARPTERATVRVTFDPAELPSRVWRVDGVLSEAGGGDPDDSVALEPDPTGCVEASFRSLPPGLAYGIGWTWPD